MDYFVALAVILIALIMIYSGFQGTAPAFITSVLGGTPATYKGNTPGAPTTGGENFGNAGPLGQLNNYPTPAGTTVSA